MSSIVLSIVNFATSAVFNNVCDRIADRLRHGDCTDEKCRQLITRELDEIKTKLDGLARKDLLSSVCFLKDGLCILNHTFEGATNEEYVEECLKIDGHEDFHWKPGSSEALHSQIAIYNKALNRSSQTLDTTSKERFISAKLSFENAYLKATDAFNNEALSTTERILATKFRVVSKILQCLEDPDMAIAFCKLFLDQLHELPAVKKRFSVFFRGQVKSHLSKKKRVDNIRCVTELNYALYEYEKSFAKNGLEILACWPKIKLGQKAINPLLVSNKVLKKMTKSGLRSPNQYLFKEINLSSKCVAVNSKGEIITKSKKGDSFKSFSSDGDMVGQFCFDSEDTQKKNFEILALAVSLDDFLHAIIRYKAGDSFEYKLYVLDANLGSVQQRVFLPCLTGPGESHHSVCIAVDANKNIFITKQDDAKVFIFDCNGNAKSSFALQGWNLIKDLNISTTGEVVAAELVGKTVGIYKEDGALKEEITLPSLHKVCGLAFDYIDNKIIVLAEVLTGCFHEYRLLSYSECGELVKTLVLPRQKRSAGYRITSHPNGPLAVVHETGAIFFRY